MIKKETIDQVKKQHEGKQLFIGTIAFVDKAGEQHKVEFIYRKPTVTDMEIFQKSSAKNGLIAQSNLLNSLIVHPAASEVTEKLSEYPAPVASFVEEQISPFFGASVVTSSQAL